MLFWGGQTSKNAFNRQLRYFMVVSGVHSSVVFNACVYSSTYACMQSTLSVCIQQYDPEPYLEHKPHDWMLLGCDQLIINTKYFFEIPSIIFPENTEQYVMLCCRCQHVKFSRLYNTLCSYACYAAHYAYFSPSIASFQICFSTCCLCPNKPQKKCSPNG